MSNPIAYLDDGDISLQSPTYTPLPNPSCNTTTTPVYYSARETKSSGGSYSYGAYICVFLILAGLIFAIIASSGLGIANTNQRTFNAFISDWHATEQERSNHAELSSRMITISAESRGITLCGIQAYHLVNKEYRPLLTETIEVIRSAEMKSHPYYHINIHLYLAIKIGEKEEEELNILYNVSSTLMPFSTIRLEELEFDTEKNGLGPMRSIVLCSDSLELNAPQRCDDKALLASKRNLFVLPGEDTVPLAILPRVNTVKGQATADLGDSLRMYNIVFYTLVDGKETRILTVEPLQC